MKKKIVAGIIALMMTAGMAMIVGPASAGNTASVNHNGHLICLSEKGAAAHVRHGDEADVISCVKKRKVTKKKVAKRKKKVAKRKTK